MLKFISVFDRLFFAYIFIVETLSVNDSTRRGGTLIDESWNGVARAALRPSACLRPSLRPLRPSACLVYCLVD